jgi:hypothetical protein
MTTPTDFENSVTLSQAKKKMASVWAVDAHRPIMMWGASGIGKSALGDSLLEPENWTEHWRKILDQSPNHKEPGRFVLRSHALDHAALNGVLVDKGDHAGWLPLGEVLPHPDRGDPPCGLIFLDEINGAVQSIQLQLMQLVYDRCTANWHCPEGYHIIAAGNRAHDRAGIQLMTSPLKRRFINMHIRADLDEWVAWALHKGIDSRLIGFMRLRPDLLITAPTRSEEAEACPRTWEFASDFLTSPRPVPPDLLLSALTDCVGSGPASELKGFLDIMDDLPDLDAIVQGHRQIAAPKGANAPSVCYAVVSGLVSRLARPPQSLKLSRPQIAENILRWTIDHLSEEYSTMLVKDAVRVADEDVSETEAFCDWAEKNEDFVL